MYTVQPVKCLHDFQKLYHLLPLLFRSRSAPFLEILLFFIGFGSSAVFSVWCVGLCVSVVCVILVLCGWGRMLPAAAASPPSPLILESTTRLAPLTAPVCGWAVVFPSSPLLMGIWAISSPLLLLVLQWIILCICHSVFLPVWYPGGLIFMRGTDGLKSKCICNFGR